MVIDSRAFVFQNNSAFLQLVSLDHLRERVKEHVQTLEASLIRSPQSVEYKLLKEYLNDITTINLKMNEAIDKAIEESKSRKWGDRFSTWVGSRVFRHWVSRTDTVVCTTAGGVAAATDLYLNNNNRLPVIIPQLIQVCCSVICGGLNELSVWFEDKSKQDMIQAYEEHKKKIIEESFFLNLLQATDELEKSQGQESSYVKCLEQLKKSHQHGSIPQAKFWINYIVSKLDDNHPHKIIFNELKNTAQKIARYNPNNQSPKDDDAPEIASVPKLLAAAAPSDSNLHLNQLESLAEESIDVLKGKYQEAFNELRNKLDIDMRQFLSTDDQIILDDKGEIIERFEGDKNGDSDASSGSVMRDTPLSPKRQITIDVPPSPASVIQARGISERKDQTS